MRAEASALTSGGGIGAATLTVTGGLGHSCAAGIGRIQCWGSDAFGQLGDNTIGGLSFHPVVVRDIGTGTAMISGGGQHTCAVVNASARCWGRNAAGQLGNGQAGDDNTVVGDSSTPVTVTNLSAGVQAIAAGDSHACAVVGNAARCWGSNGFGQLGDGSTATHRSPAPVTGMGSGVQAITAGGNHSCAIVNGAAKCWGLNDKGQLGNGAPGQPPPGNSNSPVPVTGLSNGVQAISAGGSHTCAIVNGAAVCWGLNGSGQLGNGQPGRPAPGDSNQPVPVTGLGSGVVAIAAGQNHSCALLSSGAVQCWGSDSDGQLGSGSSDPDVPLPPDSNVPVQVTGLTGGVQSIATGYQHSCAATTTGSAFCWGSNGADEIAIDQSTGGTKIGAPHQIPDVVVGGCADGTDEQVFNNAMVGCAGTVTFDNRATLCAAGYQPATAVQWVSNRGGGVPLHNYWTNDPLLWAGGGTSSCYVSLSVGQTSCNGMPMRICTGSGSDPEGNVCNWQHCGLYTNTPDSFFGGCFSNQTAGTACIPTGAPANACTSVKSCPKWENGITLDPMTGTALEPTTTFGNGVRHLQCTSTNHGLSCDAPPTIRGTIDGPEPLACEAAASARLTQLQTDVANSVALETNFDSMAALNARSAQAQASVSATRGGNTIQQFNFISTPVGPPNNPNGLLLLQWDERWMCQVNTVNAKPTSAPNDACGCNN